MWQLVLEEIEGDEVLFRVSDGEVELTVLVQIVFNGRAAAMLHCHMHGAGPNRVGAGRLRSLANWAKEFLDVDTLSVAGAVRTSGALPGRRPGILVF
jgi:hypothetical protein